MTLHRVLAQEPLRTSKENAIRTVTKGNTDRGREREREKKPLRFTGLSGNNGIVFVSFWMHSVSVQTLSTDLTSNRWRGNKLEK